MTIDLFIEKTLNITTMGYVRDQLDRIETDGTYPATFKVFSTKCATNWMVLDAHSAKDLREWLDRNFPQTDLDEQNYVES